MEIDGNITQDTSNDCINKFTKQLQDLVEPVYSECM